MSDNRESDERDYKFSQYFVAPNGNELRVVSYRTDDGFFYRVDNDSNETSISAGGPYTNRAAASEAGREILFQELNDWEKPLDRKRDDDHEQGR